MADHYSVRVPATSANLGCLLDCAALALNLYLDLRLTPRADGSVSVRYSGADAERVPLDETNLIAQVIIETLEGWGERRGFDLEIHNNIPVGVGLGSSAAAIVGALALSHRMAERTPGDEALVTMAARHEGHPDNVAAAWHGGFTIAAEHAGRVTAYSCPVPDTAFFVVVVPDYALPTEKARQVLPASYPRADAVHNLQRGALLAAQFFSGKADFHDFLFDDRWHQPYRRELVPGLDELLQLSLPGLQGICLSGAGPAVLALVSRKPEAIGTEIVRVLSRHVVKAQPYILLADNKGAKGWYLFD